MEHILGTWQVGSGKLNWRVTKGEGEKLSTLLTFFSNYAGELRVISLR